MWPGAKIFARGKELLTLIDLQQILPILIQKLGFVIHTNRKSVAHSANMSSVALYPTGRTVCASPETTETLEFAPKFRSDRKLYFGSFDISKTSERIRINICGQIFETSYANIRQVVNFIWVKKFGRHRDSNLVP